MCGLRHFARFKQVARLVFVTHGHRYDVQLGQRSELVARSRKCEHLYKCGFGSVQSVFCAAISLCNPYRRASVYDGMPDVSRQVQLAFVELPLVSAALHAKHLVAFADVYHGWVGHEVGSKGYFAGIVSCIHQCVLQQRGI